MTTARLTGRSGTAVTKREFDSLRADILSQFTEMRKEIQAMLPRELYDVRHKEMVEDHAELKARVAKTEQTIIDLNTQLLSVRQQTPAQISSSSQQVRYDMLNKAFDMFAKVAFFVGGIIASYFIYHH